MSFEQLVKGYEKEVLLLQEEWIRQFKIELGMIVKKYNRLANREFANPKGGEQ